MRTSDTLDYWGITYLLNHFNTADYIFLFFVGIVLMGLIKEWITLLFDGDSYIPLLLIVIVGLGISYYINYIPYGIYKAKYVEYNGKKVGEGTKENESFELDIDREYIRRDKVSKIPLCSDKSNLYVTTYCTKYTQVTVTAMGTVKYTKRYGKSTIKATVDVSY